MRSNFFARVITLFLIVVQVSVCPAAADSHDRDSSRFTESSSREMMQKGSVYVYGDESLDNLVMVRVLGAVLKAGIHYVPTNTDLLTLLSLAGGPTDKADLKEITIKRGAAGSEVIKVNLEHVVGSSKGISPILMSNDTILIPQNDPFISDSTLRTVSIVTGVATVFSAVVIGVAQLNK